MLFLLGVLAGLVLPVQTSINTNFRSHLQATPFLASMMSFTVGTAVLLLVLIFQQSAILVPFDTIENNPWWI